MNTLSCLIQLVAYGSNNVDIHTNLNYHTTFNYKNKSRTKKQKNKIKTSQHNFTKPKKHYNAQKTNEVFTKTKKIISSYKHFKCLTGKELYNFNKKQNCCKFTQNQIKHIVNQNIILHLLHLKLRFQN